MSRVEKIEHEIRGLSPEELIAFRQWFHEFDSEVWDRQLEADARSGKLDALAEAALKAYESGDSSEL